MSDPTPPFEVRCTRRSTRSSTKPPNGEHLDFQACLTPKKRKALADRATTVKSPKSSKRQYAEPEKYAHLEYLTDYLREGLDVVFCGINPGIVSATVGHHFANPTNQFWKCLHQSGFTPRLLKPEEDLNLPEICNSGMTDLVDRPSAEQAELSNAEMSESVPSLLRKVALYRPRIVCFVGKGMWTIVEKAFKASIKSSTLNGSKPSASTALPFTWDLQPYRVVHPLESTKTTPDETLFFVVSSTSGRVAGYQLPDKVEMFKRLHARLGQLKHSTYDTSSMTIVPVPPPL